MFNRLSAQSAIRRLLVPGQSYIVWVSNPEGGIDTREIVYQRGTLKNECIVRVYDSDRHVLAVNPHVWDTLVEDGLYEVRYESLYDPGFHTGLFRFDFHPSRDTPRLVEEADYYPLTIEKFYDQFVVLAARRCE